MKDKPEPRPRIVRMATAGNGECPMGRVPRGMEVLIKKAVVDPEFREILIRERSASASRIGLKLDAMERTMLDTIPESHLVTLINRTRVTPRLREAFLGYAAAVMLAALGSDVLAGEPEQMVTKGIDPDTSYVGVDEAPAAYGNLTGIVRDDKGITLSNVVVRLELDFYYILESEATSTQPIAGLDPKVTSKVKPKTSVVREVTTNSDGVFRMDMLPVGVYAVLLTREGYYMLGFPSVEITAKGDTRVEWEMQRGWGVNPGPVGGARPDDPRE